MSIAETLAQKGKWKVNLEESLKFITHLLENKYPKNSVEYLSQKEIWKKSLDYQLGENTWFLFENNTFWEFYNENDWLKKLFFVVDEQEKSIKLRKTENTSDNYILKLDILKITKKILVFYVSEDNSYDDFSHHRLIVFCEFFE